MPCPLLESNNYPDYIKAILKEIEVGNDDALKKCACSLRTVLDDQHECAEQMTDGKLALFPFCIEDTETDPTTIYVPGSPSDYWIFPVGLSLDDLMLLYWQNYEVSISGTDSLSCPPVPGTPPTPPINIITSACGNINKAYYGQYGSKAAIKENTKYLVCDTTFYADTPRTCFLNENQYGCVECVNNSWGGIIVFSDWANHPVCYRYNNKYYPDLSFVSNKLSSTQHDYGKRGEAKLKTKNNSYSFSMYDPVDYSPCVPSIANASVSI